uniref:RE73786p n=1 Tax=Drosophila melanogaster TaxID=7227 RepID=Q8IGK2_DROME|nr:RE73786p [Drosophila melanogaster]
MRTEAAVSCFLLVLHRVCCQSGNDESWLSPDPAWSDLVNDINQPGELCQCPTCPDVSPVAMEDAVALTYFKKFVNLLFQRKRFQYDVMSAVHKRPLLFSLIPSQLDELERVQDARDLDVLLTKILESAEEAPLFNGRSGCSYVRHGFFSLLVDIFKDVIELTQTTEVKFILYATLAIALVVIVHKRFRVGLISIVLGGVFLCGYIQTYLECNRELDIDRMIEVVNHHHEPESSWFGRLLGYIYQASPKTKKIEMIKKSAKISISICMPDQVFFMYMNNIFIKQLEIMIEKVSVTMTKLSSGLSFPYNLLAPVLLVFLVGYTIKLCFKYILSPRAWASLLHKPAPQGTPTIHQSINARAPEGDSISGDNLKMLLNVINVRNVPKESLQRIPDVSGVQELEEKQEAPTTPSKKENLDESDSSSKSKSKSCVAEDEGFTLVDDHEDNNIDNV